MDKMPRLRLKKCVEAIDNAKRFLAGGVHYNFHGPSPRAVPFQRGQGSRLWDLDGNEHLDLAGKFGALIVGHNHVEYNQQLKACIDKVLAVDLAYLEAEVCELVVKHVPGAELVRFGLSGTESVQNAIRLARACTGKTKFIRFSGHYHGNADPVMGGAAGGDGGFVPVDDEDDYLGTEGRAPGILQRQSFIAEWDNPTVLRELLARHSDETCALIMEPICVNGGGLMPSAGYLDEVRDLCDRHGVLLIFDEVITGFRVGLGGAQGLFGVTPDLTILGKAIAGGGLPVSAIAGRKEILDRYTSHRVIQAGTFNGYPLGLAAVLATLRILEADEGCYERMAGLLRRIGNALEAAARDAGIPLVVQGPGDPLLYHSRSTPVEASVGYEEDVKIRDFVINDVCREHGIHFGVLSRMFGNVQMVDSDVAFFEGRIAEAMLDARELLEMGGWTPEETA